MNVNLVAAHITHPSEDVLYLDEGDPLLLRCNTSGWPSRVWYRAGEGEMDPVYRAIDTSHASGFYTVSHTISASNQVERQPNVMKKLMLINKYLNGIAVA